MRQIGRDVGKLLGQKPERLVAKGDQQFVTNHRKHNRSWKVWIDVMRLCYEMCHVLLCCVICLYVLACYRMLALLAVFIYSNVVTKCKIAKKIHLEFSTQEGKFGSGTFLELCTFVKHKIPPASGLKIRKCLPPRIWCSTTVNHKRNCYQTSLVACGSSLQQSETSQRPWDSSFSACTRSRAVAGVKTLSFLCSQVYWCCNQKSLSKKKNGAQIRIV